MSSSDQAMKISNAIAEVIGQVAPEADLSGLRGDADLRDELDIDSMDFLNIMVGIHERLGVDIPERDYGRVTTLDALTAYVRAATAQAHPSGR